MAASEADVGIQCYVTKHAGFSGVLKQRFTDFQVYEVSLNNQVALLTSRELPAAAAAAAAAAVKHCETLDAANIDAVCTDFERVAGASNAAILKRHLTHCLAAQQQQQEATSAAAQGDAQHALAADDKGAAATSAATADAGAMLEAVDDKETRRSIHNFFKQESRLPPIVTETVQCSAEGSNSPPQSRICIMLLQRTARGAANGDGVKGAGGKWRRGRGEWSGGAGKSFTRFVLRKENCDTAAAVSSLCRTLRLQPSCFGFAGTKDKRAITQQFMTAFKVEPQRLLGAAAKSRGVDVGNFEYVDAAMSLGQLNGNAFHIVIRNVLDASVEQVEAACAAVQQQGFINYFGLQRFGQGGTATHRVGAQLLKGNWKDAVHSILGGRDDEAAAVKAARALYFENNDISGALNSLPKFMTAERSVLQGLVKHGAANYVNALHGLPRNLRTMYVHAYQSYLWNAAASHRITTFGCDVVAGDVVLRKSAVQHADAIRADDVDEINGADDGEDNGGSDETTSASALRLQAAHIVTAEEAAAGMFSIDDVVLPLPGNAVLYPKHATAQVYKDLADKDGVSLTSSPHGVKDFSMAALRGDYRHVLHRPTTMQFATHTYRRHDDEICAADSIAFLQWLQSLDLLHAAAVPSSLSSQAALQPIANSTSQAPQAVDAAVAPIVQSGDMAAADVAATSLDGADVAADVADMAATSVDVVAAAGCSQDVSNKRKLLEVKLADGAAADDQAPNKLARADDAAPQTTPSPHAVAVTASVQEDTPAATLTEAAPGAAEASKAKAVEVDGKEREKSFTALILRFVLPPSCYATMLIREIMKCSTDVGHHKQLTKNQQHTSE